MSHTTEPDLGTDPRVPALASVLRQHRSLTAVIQSPEQYAEQHLLRLWGAHHTLENVATAIGQAAADTPAGERPAETLRRIRTYVQAVETRRSKPLTEVSLPIQSALVRPEGGLRPGGPITVKARGAGN